MTDWAPDPDGWESARRRGLAERGLAHLRRLSAACEDRLARREAAAALIAEVGGAPPPPDVDGGTSAADATRGARIDRLLDRVAELEREFAAELEGRSFGERYAAVERGAVPDGFYDGFLSPAALAARVDEARRYADAIESALT